MKKYKENEKELRFYYSKNITCYLLCNKKHGFYYYQNLLNKSAYKGYFIMNIQCGHWEHHTQFKYFM